MPQSSTNHSHRSSHHSSGRRDKGSGYPKGESLWRVYWEWVWGCCNCGIQAGMSVVIDHCPECVHLRCQNCPLEAVKRRGLGGSGSGPSYSASSTDTIPWRVPWSSEYSPGTVTTNRLSNPAMTEERGEKKDALDGVDRLGSIDSHSEQESARVSAIASKAPSSPTTSPSSSQESMRGPSVFTDGENSTESDTEVESSETESEDLESDLFLGVSANTIRILEASLLSSLSGDLNLAARLIPRIYGLLQLRNSQTALAPTSPGPSDAEQNSDASEPSNTSSSSVTPPNGESLQKSEGRKRGRDANEDEARDERTNKRPERTDPRSAEKIDEGPPPTFACHFRKKDPTKYNPLNDRKYHNCISPRIPNHRLRAIKDHFKVHRTPQCDRCYLVFETVDELKAHRQRLESCQIGCSELKEGIDESQWQKIERVLRAKTDKGKSAVEKWYDIWEILFPEVQRPSNPWSELAIQSTSALLSVESIASRFEESIERRIDQGVIRRDEAYPHWMEALREALAMNQIPSSNNRTPSPLFTTTAAASGRRTNPISDRHTFGTDLERSPSAGNRSNSAHVPPELPTQDQDSGNISEPSDPSFRLAIPSEPTRLPGDLHQSTSSHSPAAEPRQTSYEPPSHRDSTPTDEPSHLQSSSLNDSAISTNSQQIAPPSDPPHLAHSQHSGDLIEDFDIPLDASFTDWLDILEDAPIGDYDWDMDRIGYENSDYLMNLLEEENQLPTAGLVFKTNSDRNKGLDRPAKPD